MVFNTILKHLLYFRRAKIMSGFVTEINKRTAKNENFREVLFTTPLSQLVVMRLNVGEDI